MKGRDCRFPVIWLTIRRLTIHHKCVTFFSMFRHVVFQALDDSSVEAFVMPICLEVVLSACCCFDAKMYVYSCESLDVNGVMFSV